jgi:hypothetical protein
MMITKIMKEDTNQLRKSIDIFIKKNYKCQ